MTPLARIPIFLAFAALCLHGGTAVPVGDLTTPTATLPATLPADTTENLASEPLNSLETSHPPTSDPSTTDVPISEPDLASYVSGMVQSIGAAVPVDIGAVVTKALDTLQSAQSELMGVLANPVTEAASIPAKDSLSALPTELLSTLPSAVNLVSEPPKTINVTLGDGTTRFTPAYVKANPGDTIMFNWVGKNNHSVTETDFIGSCNKSLAVGAFDSGIQGPGTQWSLVLPSNARGLKFFFCKVAKHCEMGGMAGTIIVPE